MNKSKTLEEIQNHHVDPKLKSAILGVFAKLYEAFEPSNGGFNYLRVEYAESVARECNRNNVFFGICLFDIKKVFFEIVDDFTEQDSEKYINYSYIEGYVSKGIFGILENGEQKRKCYSAEELQKMECRIPALTINALKYHYNNDRDSFVE